MHSKKISVAIFLTVALLCMHSVYCQLIQYPTDRPDSKEEIKRQADEYNAQQMLNAQILGNRIQSQQNFGQQLQPTYQQVQPQNQNQFQQSPIPYQPNQQNLNPIYNQNQRQPIDNSRRPTNATPTIPIFSNQQPIRPEQANQIPFDSEETVSTRNSKTPERLRFINQFSWKLFRESKLPNPETNYVLSPISVQLLLALIAPASEGETKEQFHQIIKNSDPRVVGTAARDMTFVHFRNELDIATAIFPSASFNLNSSFVENAKKSFVKIIPVNYENQNEATQTINSWASHATKNQINQIVPSGSLSGTKMLLSNAVFFRGFWTFPFNETMEGVFQPNANVLSHGRVTMMKLDKVLPYGKTQLKNGLSYEWMELPYEKDEFSMLLVMPLERWGLENLMRSMSFDDFEDLTNNVGSYRKKNVHLKLPKFSIKSSFSLVNTLIKLGLTSPFTSLSNIPYMAYNEFVRIDDAVQQAILTVDEKGSTAAAVTTFSVIALSSGSNIIEDVDFIVDQPFLSVIIDKKQNLPIFISKIYAPL